MVCPLCIVAFAGTDTPRPLGAAPSAPSYAVAVPIVAGALAGLAVLALVLRKRGPP